MDKFSIERLSDAPLHASRITCEGKVWRSRRNHRTGGLVAFRGVYPPERGEIGWSLETPCPLFVGNSNALDA